MATLRANSSKKNGILMLKIVAEKLQKSLSLARTPALDFEVFREVISSKSTYSLPQDVKKGHFAVIAIDNGKPKRFVVPLSYLNHPVFLRLLEQAADEFGFDHEGAVSIPCRWSELEKILASQWKEDRDVDA